MARKKPDAPSGFFFFYSHSNIFFRCPRMLWSGTMICRENRGSPDPLSLFWQAFWLLPAFLGRRFRQFFFDITCGITIRRTRQKRSLVTNSLFDFDLVESIFLQAVETTSRNSRKPSEEFCGFLLRFTTGHIDYDRDIFSTCPQLIPI